MQNNILDKKDQLQTLINIMGALDLIKISGSEALLWVQIKVGLETVIKSMNNEISIPETMTK